MLSLGKYDWSRTQVTSILLAFVVLCIFGVICGCACLRVFICVCVCVCAFPVRPRIRLQVHPPNLLLRRSSEEDVNKVNETMTAEPVTWSRLSP